MMKFLEFPDEINFQFFFGRGNPATRQLFPKFVLVSERTESNVNRMENIFDILIPIYPKIYFHPYVNEITNQQFSKQI